MERGANIFLFTFINKLSAIKIMDLRSYIRNVPDFPREGIVFKDITPLLKDCMAFEMAKNALLQQVGNQQIDKVVGIESRGFFFGPLLALDLNAGFVPVRKMGKLPFSTLSETYALEYGTDTLEIHSDGITKGERVLVHDDVLATGGTARAVCKLIEKLGGEVVQLSFLIQLDFLNGNDRLKGYTIKTVINY